MPGSFSDYIVTIDVATGAVTSAHVSGILDTDDPITGETLAQDMDTFQVLATR